MSERIHLDNPLDQFQSAIETKQAEEAEQQRLAEAAELKARQEAVHDAWLKPESGKPETADELKAVAKQMKMVEDKLGSYEHIKPSVVRVDKEPSAPGVTHGFNYESEVFLKPERAKKIGERVYEKQVKDAGNSLEKLDAGAAKAREAGLDDLADRFEARKTEELAKPEVQARLKQEKAAADKAVAEEKRAAPYKRLRRTNAITAKRINPQSASPDTPLTVVKPLDRPAPAPVIKAPESPKSTKADAPKRNKKLSAILGRNASGNVAAATQESPAQEPRTKETAGQTHADTKGSKPAAKPVGVREQSRESASSPAPKSAKKDDGPKAGSLKRLEGFTWRTGEAGKADSATNSADEATVSEVVPKTRIKRIGRYLGRLVTPEIIEGAYSGHLPYVTERLRARMPEKQPSKKEETTRLAKVKSVGSKVLDVYQQFDLVASEKFGNIEDASARGRKKALDSIKSQRQKRNAKRQEEARASAGLDLLSDTSDKAA